MSIGTVIPDLDNTLSPDEVKRKTFDEKLHTAFNEDQIAVLNELISRGGGSSITWNQTVTEGTKIAEVTIDDDTTSVYTPEAVQSDWNETDDSDFAFINNKPFVGNAICVDWGTPYATLLGYINNNVHITNLYVATEPNFPMCVVCKIAPPESEGGDIEIKVSQGTSTDIITVSSDDTWAWD